MSTELMLLKKIYTENNEYKNKISELILTKRQINSYKTVSSRTGCRP